MSEIITVVVFSVIQHSGWSLNGLDLNIAVLWVYQGGSTVQLPTM